MESEDMTSSLLKKLRRGEQDDHAAAGRQFQVILTLQPVEGEDADELARKVETAVDVLVRDAAGIVLGVVGSADFERCAVELEFTVPVETPEELYQRMGTVLGCLRGAGFEFQGSEERVADETRELEPAL